MAVEVGQVYRGSVVRILDYGALVRLEEGSVGLVHISEIANTYVRDVNDYFQLHDNVVVKVLAIGDRNRIELSTKQAQGQEVKEVPVAESNGGGPVEVQARRESRASFDQKMETFMRDSSERLADIKRNIENKRGNKKTSR